ncbi:unnamed protein product [Gordionus sp. m RMFG-2023]
MFYSALLYPNKKSICGLLLLNDFIISLQFDQPLVEVDLKHISCKFLVLGKTLELILKKKLENYFFHDNINDIASGKRKNPTKRRKKSGLNANETSSDTDYLFLFHEWVTGKLHGICKFIKSELIGSRFSEPISHRYHLGILEYAFDILDSLLKSSDLLFESNFYFIFEFLTRDMFNNIRSSGDFFNACPKYINYDNDNDNSDNLDSIKMIHVIIKKSDILMSTGLDMFFKLRKVQDALSKYLESISQFYSKYLVTSTNNDWEYYLLHISTKKGFEKIFKSSPFQNLMDCWDLLLSHIKNDSLNSHNAWILNCLLRNFPLLRTNFSGFHKITASRLLSDTLALIFNAIERNDFEKENAKMIINICRLSYQMTEICMNIHHYKLKEISIDYFDKEEPLLVMLQNKIHSRLRRIIRHLANLGIEGAMESFDYIPTIKDMLFTIQFIVQGDIHLNALLDIDFISKESLPHYHYKYMLSLMDGTILKSINLHYNIDNNDLITIETFSPMNFKGYMKNVMIPLIKYITIFPCDNIHKDVNDSSNNNNDKEHIFKVIGNFLFRLFILGSNLSQDLFGKVFDSILSILQEVSYEVLYYTHVTGIQYTESLISRRVEKTNQQPFGLSFSTNDIISNMLPILVKTALSLSHHPDRFALLFTETKISDSFNLVCELYYFFQNEKIFFELDEISYTHRLYYIFSTMWYSMNFCKLSWINIRSFIFRPLYRFLAIHFNVEYNLFMKSEAITKDYLDYYIYPPSLIKMSVERGFDCYLALVKTGKDNAQPFLEEIDEILGLGHTDIESYTANQISLMEMDRMSIHILILENIFRVNNDKSHTHFHTEIIKFLSDRLEKYTKDVGKEINDANFNLGMKMIFNNIQAYLYVLIKLHTLHCKLVFSRHCEYLKSNEEIIIINHDKKDEKARINICDRVFIKQIFFILESIHYYLSSHVNPQAIDKMISLSHIIIEYVTLFDGKYYYSDINVKKSLSNQSILESKISNSSQIFIRSLNIILTVLKNKSSKSDPDNMKTSEVGDNVGTPQRFSFYIFRVAYTIMKQLLNFGIINYKSQKEFFLAFAGEQKKNSLNKDTTNNIKILHVCYMGEKFKSCWSHISNVINGLDGVDDLNVFLNFLYQISIKVNCFN